MTACRRPCGTQRALGADAASLAEAYSPARCQRRAGAFGLSAGVAMGLRLGWDLGLEAKEDWAQLSSVFRNTKRVRIDET